MTYNLNYFRSQVRRVIDTAPTHVTITRDVWVSDGYGGRKRDTNTKGSIVHSDLRCVFDNASSPNLSVNASDGGRVISQNSIRLIILWEQGLDIRRDDAVTVLVSDRKYQVTEVNNILEQNILLEVKLEVKD